MISDQVVEVDPNGYSQHTPGAKLDSGKIEASLLTDFGYALMAVADVGTYGAQKYTRGGWAKVPDGIRRYTDALLRHILKEPYESVDPDSDYEHAVHVAWNALARLELMIRDQNRENS